eukprot:7376103-Alexandrium_andersonii.AAC.1
MAPDKQTGTDPHRLQQVPNPGAEIRRPFAPPRMKRTVPPSGVGSPGRDRAPACSDLARPTPALQ